jgi:hydrogenase expression/formation protein HypE
VGIVVDEGTFPMLDAVKAACEMLGLDPLYVANEGVAVVIVAAEDADAVLAAARSVPTGARAATVGAVDERPASGPAVRLRTGLGATRPLLMLTGDQLPRIC